MIEEIKRRLENGEVVELECVTAYDFINNNKGHVREKEEILSSSLVVHSVDDDRAVVLHSNYFLRESDLEYFRIKRHTPTFNDLIDVAMKAWKDGYLKVLEFERGDGEQIFTVIGEDALRWHEGDSDYGYGVDLINSLYTETFVIESEEDTLKIDTSGSEIIKVILANNEVLSSNYLDCLCDISDGFRFKILKGATVTQKRGK